MLISPCRDHAELMCDSAMIIQQLSYVISMSTCQQMVVEGQPHLLLHDLLEGGQSNGLSLLERQVRPVLLLQSGLCALAPRPNRHGVALGVGAAGVSAEQHGPPVVPARDQQRHAERSALRNAKNLTGGAFVQESQSLSSCSYIKAKQKCETICFGLSGIKCLRPDLATCICWLCRSHHAAAAAAVVIFVLTELQR